VANNNYPQITSVTSEALQAQIRNLLPSQEGFGTDLLAQNVIVPIIDLTTAAEGSSVPEYLQTALSFGSQTAFSVANTTSTLINNTGFYRIFGAITFRQGATDCLAKFNLTDGLSTKIIYALNGLNSGTTDVAYSLNFDFVVFLSAGESLTATSNQIYIFLDGSTRQVADINGTLVQPVGFNPQ